MKKLLAIMLAAIMLLGVLAGCGAKEAAPEAEKPVESTGEATSEKNEEPDRQEEPVELTWYVPGNGPEADDAVVEAAINEYLKGKLNCTIKLVKSTFGDFPQKMQTMIAGQTEFDICFTSDWNNNFYSNVSKNAFLPLNELLDTYAPELKAQISEQGWAAASVDGQIMAIPNEQIWAGANTLYLRKDYVDKYNFDYTSVDSLDDLTPFFEMIKADEPDQFMMVMNSTRGMYDFVTTYLGFDTLCGTLVPGAIEYKNGDLTAINQFATPQVQELYELMYEWNQKGFIRKDARTYSGTMDDMYAGQYVAHIEANGKPGVQLQIENAYWGGREVYVIELSQPLLRTSGIVATMNAISRTSKHPEMAVQFLNLVNTDKELYNLIIHGIEGTHYERIDDTYIRMAENSAYNPANDWIYGCQWNADLKEGEEADVWEQTIAINNSAVASPALGFAFDSTPVQTEIASVSAVVAEYQTALDAGNLDPAVGLPEFLEKLDNAGCQTIIDELQAQLDAWAATK